MSLELKLLLKKLGYKNVKRYGDSQAGAVFTTSTDTLLLNAGKVYIADKSEVAKAVANKLIELSNSKLNYRVKSI